MKVVAGTIDVKVNLPAGQMVMDVAQGLLLGPCAKDQVLLRQAPAQCGTALMWLPACMTGTRLCRQINTLAMLEQMHQHWLRAHHWSS